MASRLKYASTRIRLQRSASLVNNALAVLDGGGQAVGAVKCADPICTTGVSR